MRPALFSALLSGVLMATLLVIALLATLALQLVASGSRWLCLVAMGLLIYAFPLHFLTIALIAGGFLYYLDTH
jgi:hypothetical protein